MNNQITTTTPRATGNDAQRVAKIELERATHYRDQWQAEKAKVATLLNALEMTKRDIGRSREATAAISDNTFDAVNLALSFGGSDQANAAFIVRACNSHAALVEALEAAVQYLDAHRPKGKIRDIFHELNQHENSVMKPARAALLLAKGGQQ
jgi:hypothetical protein